MKRDPLFEIIETVVSYALRWVRWRSGVARPEAHPAQVGSERGREWRLTAVFEAPAVVAGLDDIAVMGDAVEQSRGHLGIAERRRPLPEGEGWS